MRCSLRDKVLFRQCVVEVFTACSPFVFVYQCQADLQLTAVVIDCTITERRM